jgi:exopolyphosphatase/guanosine-5'-triphosphate,3'-diphosphate pyrophosphatase
MPAADRLSLPGMEKGREDLMPAGTIICREVMRHAGADRLLVTEGGVLEGLAVWPEWPPTEGRWLTP